MSKMSQLAMELEEQATELGFESLEQAQDNGYEVISDGKFAKLVKSESEEDKAHEAWLKERDEVLSIIESIKEDIVELNNGDNKHVAIDELNRVIDFVEGCHD